MNAAKSVTASFALKPSSVAASRGANAPTDRTINKGSLNNPALSFALTLPGGQLSSITLSVSGTGNDAADLTNVKIYRDANANGLVDSSEVVVAQGKFNADNGTLTLTPTTTTALAASGTTQFLVVVDVNSSLAALRFVPALGGLLLLGLGVRRRRWLGALGLAVLLTACPTPTVVQNSYQLKLESVNLSSSGTVVSVTALPMVGATLTVQK